MSDEIKDKNEINEENTPQEHSDYKPVNRFDASAVHHLSGMYQNWFLDYASYVILERAVPHIEDGLKPVQRRILHSMKRMDDGRYNKVANIVGHTMQFHPHGDASIGDALVQMGQKDLLIDTQGNWGNILTGDRAAAPRYIEARLSKFALDVVFNPKTTDWQLSYDGRNKEPITLPAKFPLLLAQGAEGIAVGLSSKVLPHNFNDLGMPTSTTVSLVFELLGATFILALFKMNADPSLMITDLMNSSKALSVIIAIFVSVAIAFFFGTAVMWLSRLVFTFRYKKHLRYSIAIFGGIAFTALAYFIFIKGLGGSPFISDATKNWINDNTQMLLVVVFVASTILNEILYLLRVNVFKIIVLLGTFALAMAFAGNDLVNFIGVPLAGLDSMQDFMANGNGDPNAFMMTSLMTSAKSPLIYLVLAGIIMIVAMATSKKAQNVVKTSVDLSRQDEGDEMFGSSKVARSLVRAVQDMGNGLSKIMPSSSTKWIDSRFNKEEMELAQGAAFDEVRAAVNLVLAAMLIIIGTNYKLPLSTTYVTFMVAMGTSLADKAWSRDSAVFRVTGVLSVIGGWFVTAGVAFAACALVCTMLHFGGFVVMIAFMVLDIYLLWRSGQAYKKEVFQGGMGQKIFDLINDTYKDLYGYSELSQKQIDQLIKSYLSFLDFNLITCIEDWTDGEHKLIGVGITMPSLAHALRKCRRGRLLPFGWFHVLRAIKMHKTNIVDLLLIGILPEYRAKGANALLFADLIPWYQKYGIEWGETQVELETNAGVQGQWGALTPVMHKRRKCYKKIIK